MLDCRKIAGSTIVLLAAMIPAHAQVLTVTGGSIAATAQAGETGYTVGSDTPAPVTVQAVGSTSLSAAANGIAVPQVPPTPSPVSASAGGMVAVTNDASGMTTLALTSQATVLLVPEGFGSYCCGQSSAIDTVFFSLSSPTQLVLDWGGTGASSQAHLVDMTTGSALYSADNNSSSTPSDLQLLPGQYEALVQSNNGGYPAFSTSADLTISAPAPVPVPGAIWLLGSGLVSLSALRARGRKRGELAGSAFPGQR